MSGCWAPTSLSDLWVLPSLDQVLHQHTGKRAPAGVVWLFACSHLVRFIKLFPSYFESNKAIYTPLWSWHTHFTVPAVVYLTKLANEVEFLAAIFSHTPLILGILQDVPTCGWEGRWLILVPVTVAYIWSVQPNYWPCEKKILCPECLFSTAIQLESEPAAQDCSPAPTEAKVV